MTFKNANHKFPAKLLLFGEYGVLFGSQALAVPFHKFNGNLELNAKQNDAVFFEWIKHMKANALNEFIDLDRLENDIQSGLYFNSSIPRNSGLGSSGALVSAVFYEYNNIESEVSIELLKEYLGLMESYFHGTSSGTDPLVSYLQEPILIKADHVITDVTIRNSLVNCPYYFFIIDSKTKSNTAPLVQNFRDKIKSPFAQRRFIETYLHYSDGAIEAIIENNPNNFWNSFLKLSVFQLDFMNELIPESISELFKKGLDSKDFLLKILGSGGGGYFLCISKKPEIPADSIPILF